MYSIGSLCTGYGGLDLAVQQVYGEMDVLWTADIDKNASKVIAARFPNSPNLGDVAKISWDKQDRPHILTGGFPCQDVSLGGSRRGMKKGTRTGLWYEVYRAINELHPYFVVLENVRGLFTASTDRGITALHAVLRDLASAGYDAEWRSVRACDAGLPHKRERVLIFAWDRALADAEHDGRDSAEVADSPSSS